ncbi:SDR family NAD(P)-dependent oxidoreductase [Frankia sp. AgB1.9]|uniref:SDR family NAD(P)-dependent oxidoreductase n=1 Tax=unclassified Frankia TaxID=2632575 RepID=UPI0019314B60|nr:MULTISPECIES: SDR family NAD(P)-dependent oxidoreductase [unclassified Frankia]MBL7487485.1 SDR family NAD(P)-dependent oxidoreductase [Frankia sp. AgW1.1]MBL7547447.1 SDR family NAD(P)-dependent oxidoreductase [Frankia sp. AgB1.9]MBL7618778.1 SDR family NAD(P)-dependent oxidoreductase [Frankia sp. AgB1.8]
MNVDGSIALVTGANRGLGARLVDRLLDAGASKVYATARDPHTVDPAVSARPRVSTLALDVTDQASVDAAAKAAADVTLLVNNAGVLGFGTALDADLDLFTRDALTNYVGLLRVSQAFAPVLTTNAPGSIVNVLTLIALAPVTGMAGYCASKAAAHSITQSLRAELRGKGVEVVGAYPGGIDTDMLAGVEADKAPPETVAERIVAGLIAGQTVIWPDDASAGAGSLYLGDPLALERTLAG